MSNTALITTTINVPTLLSDYADDARNHQQNIKIYVAGDKKTPETAKDFCAKIEQTNGIECEYLDVIDQQKFLKPYPDLDNHLPWNCVQRRNVAILKAFVEGATTIITIDDDNFLVTENYFAAQATGQDKQLDQFGKPNQWFNVCNFLTEQNDRKFFPRGYGMSSRSLAPDLSHSTSNKKIAVNAGLWLGDPDIDAVTRLAAPVSATGYSRSENFFIGTGAFTSFNSQNTALDRSVIPAYFLSPYVGRYDDIFISYIIKRIADYFNQGVSFGFPLVRQDRNEHDLYVDLAAEIMGMKITDEFLATLASVKLSGTNYAECLLEICEQVSPLIQKSNSLTRTEQASMNQFWQGCKIWANLPIW